MLPALNSAVADEASPASDGDHHTGDRRRMSPSQPDEFRRSRRQRVKRTIPDFSVASAVVERVSRPFDLARTVLRVLPPLCLFGLRGVR